MSHAEHAQLAQPGSSIAGRRGRVIVTGLVATYPFGGVFWDYMQYVVGLRRLGFEVLYIEDTGRWSYDPRGDTFRPDGAWNARYLSEQIAGLDGTIQPTWFYRDGAGVEYGTAWRDVVAFCETADLFIHISASCWMREEYYRAGTTVFIDSDPMYTQASVPDYLRGSAEEDARARVDMLRQHDKFFTFGENIGAEDCLVPDGLFDWKPTRQPIVLGLFDGASTPSNERRRMLTTVGSWESSEGGTRVGGIEYGGKGDSFEQFIDLPQRSSVPLELAMSGKAPRSRLLANGWQLVDPKLKCGTPLAYRDYLADSLAEWSVAKHAYVASRSGWFSCRSACYLALGVPTIVQDTGFVVPAGLGVLSFDDLDSAAAAIDRVASATEAQSRAAREIAVEYFRAEKVLEELVAVASSATSST